jgi:hypothetical protein
LRYALRVPEKINIQRLRIRKSRQCLIRETTTNTPRITSVRPTILSMIGSTLSGSRAPIRIAKEPIRNTTSAWPSA